MSQAWNYQKGLHTLGDGTYAYLQPNGSWGWSNAGLICSGEHALLVDTLFDLRLTEQMLVEMRRASPAAKAIETVVNTHANGDHCWGNQLVRSAEIIASRRGAEEMVELPPKKVAMLLKVARIVSRLGKPGKLLTRALGRVGLGQIAAIGEAAEFVLEIFGSFEFDGIELVPPTRTFDGELALRVGDREVLLVEVGPAHTRGDVLVHLPQDRTVFTGDILFVGGHPIVWEGPVSNWIAACERILAMDVETVVPGHGPITDKAGVARVKTYLAYLQTEARKRFDAGMDVAAAARDIAMDDFSGWGEGERVAVNVHTLYREFRGEAQTPDAVAMFACMARHHRFLHGHGR